MIKKVNLGTLIGRSGMKFKFVTLYAFRRRRELGGFAQALRLFIYMKSHIEWGVSFG